MQLILSNPWGWLGLLLIPAITLIHCLQRQQKPVVISTLFLVHSGDRERRGGRKFVFWRHSITYWMQILAALLLTWLLLQPRWIGEQSVQRIAYVVDSSLSMEAFQEAMNNELSRSSGEFEKTAAETDWLLMESDPQAALLYRGDDREAMLNALGNWQASLGQHDWSTAIGSARALVGEDGVVVFVTDHKPSAEAFKMSTLAVGEAVDNLGFTGVQVGMSEDGMAWETLLKNYGRNPASKNWWIEIEGQATEARQANIPAGGSLALGGLFPRGVKQLTLVLEADAWPIDNRLPVVRPEAKGIAYAVAVDSEPDRERLRELMKSLGDTFRGTLDGKTDILIAESLELRTLADAPSAQILFAPSGDFEVPQGLISREEDAYNEGINWNSLAVRGGTRDYQLGPGERPLAWLGNVPLIWLREKDNGRDLVFNFALEDSNALRLPATVLLIGRFVDSIRENKVGYEGRNLELGQAISVALPDAPELSLNGNKVEAAGQLRIDAPERPDYIEVNAGEEKLLLAAAHFSDVREANLLGANHYDNQADALSELITMNSEKDAFSAWWLLLLAGVLLAGWHYAERGR